MSYNLQERCTWQKFDEAKIKRNFKHKASSRLSDMLRNARKRWEREQVRPNWIGEEIFEELIEWWKTKDFLRRSEHGKKMRASEAGGCVSTVGSITIGEHRRRMVIITIFLSSILNYYIHI